MMPTDKQPNLRTERDVESLSIRELLDATTWEMIKSDGIVTLDEIDDALRAKGLKPEEYDHLYE